VVVIRLAGVVLGLALILAGCSDDEATPTGPITANTYGRNTTTMPPDAHPGRGAEPTRQVSNTPGLNEPSNMGTNRPLPPNIAPQLQQAAQMAGQMCQAGQPQGCQAAQWFGQMSMGLANAYQACQQGNPDACQAYAREAPRAQAAMQQFQSQFGGGNPGQEPGYVE
jgi:hypothetical protein